MIKKNQTADAVIFPEMILTGYQSMDHILDHLIQSENLKGIYKVKVITSSPTITVGSFTQPKELKGRFQPFLKKIKF